MDPGKSMKFSKRLIQIKEEAKLLSISDRSDDSVKKEIARLESEISSLKEQEPKDLFNKYKSGVLLKEYKSFLADNNKTEVTPEGFATWLFKNLSRIKSELQRDLLDKKKKDYEKSLIGKIFPKDFEKKIVGMIDFLNKKMPKTNSLSH